MMNTTRSFAVLYAIIFSFIAMSCSSDDDIKDKMGQNSGVYYFRFKVDGVKIEYVYTNTSNNLYGSYNITADQEYYTTTVSGMEIFPQSRKNALQVVMVNPGEFEPGVDYSNYATSDTNIEPETFDMVFYDDNEVSYQVLNEAVQIVVFQHEGDAKINFSEIDKDHMKGTFSGTFYNHDGFVKVTEGEFSVPRSQ